jgi:hypothetical protein
MLEQTAVLDDMIYLLVQRQARDGDTHRVNQPQKTEQCVGGAAGQHARIDHGSARLPQGESLRPATIADFRHGALADPPCGQVHHALERGVVVAVRGQA